MPNLNKYKLVYSILYLSLSVLSFLCKYEKKKIFTPKCSLSLNLPMKSFVFMVELFTYSEENFPNFLI